MRIHPKRFGTASNVLPVLRVVCDNNLCSSAVSHAQSCKEILMGDLFQPWHLILIAGLAILLFGGKKLPELGKGLGEGLRGFKEGMKGIGGDDSAEDRATADAKAAAEARAYQEAKLAAEARVAAEARLAAEQRDREQVTR
jgi:sec-independent protein translocase protein TatA